MYCGVLLIGIKWNAAEHGPSWLSGGNVTFSGNSSGKSCVGLHRKSLYNHETTERHNRVKRTFCFWTYGARVAPKQFHRKLCTSASVQATENTRWNFWEGGGDHLYFFQETGSDTSGLVEGWEILCCLQLSVPPTSVCALMLLWKMPLKWPDNTPIAASLCFGLSALHCYCVKYVYWFTFACIWRDFEGCLHIFC